MIIKLLRYLFGAINSRIITALDTVYHFIAIFRYINNLPGTLPSLKQVYLFSMKNLLKWFALLALVSLSRRFVIFSFAFNFIPLWWIILSGTFSCRAYS